MQPSTLAQTARKSPPALPGAPLIGHLLEFGREPLALLRRAHRRLGPIFTFRLGRKAVTVLIGPELHRLFFSLPGSVLGVREVYDGVVPVFGGRFPLAASEEAAKDLRPVLSRAFGPQQLVFYAEAVAREVDVWAARLPSRGRIDLVESFGRLFVYAAARAFLGDGFRVRHEDLIWPLACQITNGPDALTPRILSLHRPRGHERAAARLRALVLDEIKRREAVLGPPDLLQHFLETSVAVPALRLSLEDVANLTAGMLWLGHESTIGHATWGVIQLLQSPAYLSVVRDEVESEVVPERSTDACLAGGLPRLERGLRETERMHPALRFIARSNLHGYEVGDFRVPAGGLTMVVPPLAHRLPDVFEDPERYDPDRFSPSRAEDRRRPFALIGLGAGARVCVARAFAYGFMKLALGRLLSDFEVELVDTRLCLDQDNHTARPAYCPISLVRRSET